MVKSKLGSVHTRERERRELPGIKGGLLVPILINIAMLEHISDWLIKREKSTYSLLVMSLNSSCSFSPSAA